MKKTSIVPPIIDFALVSVAVPLSVHRSCPSLFAKLNPMITLELPTTDGGRVRI